MDTEHVYEREMWEDGLDFLREGEVFTWDDRPLHLRAIVQRRWGWPKKSAYAAADYLKQQANGEPVVIWLRKNHRQRQQSEIIAALPDVLLDLLSGLSRGVQKEVFDAGRNVQSVTVMLNRPITDEGMVSEIVRGIGWRLGANMEELRDATSFSTPQDGHIRLVVNAHRFDP